MNSKQITQFLEEGYVLVPRAIRSSVIDSAKSFIEKDLEKFGRDRTPYGTYCPRLINHTNIRQLCQEVVHLIASLLGQPVFVPEDCQIALIFPGVQETKSQTHWHIDGMNRSKIDNFSVLVGVYLSDSLSENQGNLAIWPSSHLVIQQVFEQLLVSMASTHLPHREQIRLANLHFCRSPPKISLVCKPNVLRVAAGDVVFAHSYTAHTPLPHTNPNMGPRYAVYFRVKTASPHSRTFNPHQLWKEFVCELPVERNSALPRFSASRLARQDCVTSLAEVARKIEVCKQVDRLS